MTVREMLPALAFIVLVANSVTVGLSSNASLRLLYNDAGRITSVSSAHAYAYSPIEVTEEGMLTVVRLLFWNVPRLQSRSPMEGIGYAQVSLLARERPIPNRSHRRRYAY